MLEGLSVHRISWLEKRVCNYLGNKVIYRMWMTLGCGVRACD